MNNCYILFLILAFYYSTDTALSQTSTVSNGSSISPSAGQLESYGINGLQNGQTESTFATRHHHLQGTGIGGSFIGTTSPTAESTPATKPTIVIPMRVTASQFRLPKLDSTFPDINNPALQSFNPALPTMPNNNVSNGQWNNPTTLDFNSPKTNLQRLPSFSGQKSLTDQMKFDKFDY